MKSRMKNSFNLAAKIVAIFYIVLLAMFAFDERVFSMGFLIHLIPTIVFLGCFLLSWFKPRLGGVAFGVAGIGTIVVFNTYREFFPFLVVSLIPLIVGVLFWFSEKH